MISIMIPTMNRSDFLIRTLNYYDKVGFQGYICIGDSSDSFHREKVQKAIDNLKNKLKIIYKTLPQNPSIYLDRQGISGIAMCLKELVGFAPTSYLVFSGDDDFLVPRSLERCVDFLEGHSEYVGAHGLRVMFHLQSKGVFGPVKWVRNRPECVLESESALDRWLDYMRYAISTQYNVHRMETWVRVYRDSSSIPMRGIGEELFPCSIMSIMGKIKELDCLSTVFQVHDDKLSCDDMDNTYQMIIHPNWHQTIQGLRSKIVEALIEKDSVDEKDAHAVVDRELWRLFARRLQEEYYDRYDESRCSLHGIRKILRDIPVLVSLVTYLRQLSDQFRKSEKRPRIPCISLNSLLKKSSPYYADFMPVYKAITNHPSSEGK